MFVKIIRNNPKPKTQEIFEPRSIEFRYLSDHERKAQKTEAIEELYLRFNDGFNQALLLFESDEIYLTSNTGQTIDRWKIGKI